MIVRLTRRQHGRVLEIVDDQMNERWKAGVIEWGSRDISEASKMRIDVAMPAIAWKRVWDVMFDHCFDNRGMRSKGVRSTDLKALKAIRAGLNARENHPALVGVAAIGMVGELVPAWKLIAPDGKRIYSPYPLTGTLFVVLAPEYREVRGQRVTQWVPSVRAPERPLLAPVEHFRFL